ncbi:hypothetical protein K7X08_023206 [Anisodus acutangulus]|uniref:Uncharacterized protein n=1 Tax=Anisodus acutangulus TaxID=402998 RepID=A0A9Q1R0V2_9SOLA|nr:hypothetical protein K7X08_023206 [Anisodus acutangulus]
MLLWTKGLTIKLLTLIANVHKTHKPPDGVVIVTDTKKNESGVKYLQTGDKEKNTTLKTHQHKKKGSTGSSLQKQVIQEPITKSTVVTKIHVGDHQVALADKVETGHDLDEESTAQNFLNSTKEGDLSPKQIEKVL